MTTTGRVWGSVMFGFSVYFLAETPAWAEESSPRGAPAATSPLPADDASRAAEEFSRAVTASSSSAQQPSRHDMESARASTEPGSGNAAAPREPPPRYVDRPRWGLAFAGASVFAGLYGLTCGTMGREACIPVVGPFLLIERRAREERERPPSDNDGIVPPLFSYVLFAEVGVLQGIALGAVVASFAVPKRVRLPATESTSFVPTLGRERAGLSVNGTF